MLAFQSQIVFKTAVRLTPSPLGNYELVSVPGGVTLVVGDDANELVDYVETSPELRWVDEREK